MTREEAVYQINQLAVISTNKEIPKITEALDMAIEALSKPNYESDTEVRLAVTDRNKDKVVLWDAFGEVEYYPTTHGRLIDADALSKKLCETTIFIKGGEVFQRMINDAPTAQAARPHGEWIDREDWNGDSYYDCSVCGESFVLFDGTPDMNLYHYCPNCGADMRGENNGHSNR